VSNAEVRWIMRVSRFAVAAFTLSSVAGAVAGEDCARLAGKTFGDATIDSATNVAPPFGVAGNNPTTPVTVNTPFCRVQGKIRPSPDSDIGFEVWLPPQAGWNGKYEGIGNGGFAGTMLYGPMDWALKGGYAVSATDTGHTGVALDATWALGHPEKIVDWGWRAIHETALASKAIIEDYYAKRPVHAYFTGCSDGGREALMEAQRFPRDYDGIVAGSPANFWTKLLTNGIWTQQALVATPDSWITPQELSVVTDAALKACRGDSGFIEDPEQCHFEPSNLGCTGIKTNECLSAPQIAALKKIYSGMVDVSGRSVFPGYSEGGESDPAGWRMWLSGAEPKRIEQTLMYGFVTGYFANMVFDDAAWSLRGQNLADALAQAERKTGRAVDATDPDLSAFKDAGGKLLHYHGWNDGGIPAKSSIEYYKEVAAKMGGIGRIQSFYRLFVAPGMQHCALGLGPNAVGGVVGLPSPSRDPAHDLVAALAHRVEDDTAPDQIIATLYRHNDPTKGIAAQRPWCPYPATARFSGQGDRADAASYTCMAPAK
jgi:Tannase and feruloyl esterase